MILSDNQACGGSLMKCTETTTTPVKEPTVYCDMICRSSAEIPTFVAMLNDAYDISVDERSGSEFSHTLHSLPDSLSPVAMETLSDDDEPMEDSSFHVKLERPNHLSLSLTNYPISNTEFQNTETKRGDVLLSDHKTLPDINFFIKTPKRTIIPLGSRKRSYDLASNEEYDQQEYEEENRPFLYTDLEPKSCSEKRIVTSCERNDCFNLKYERLSNNHQVHMRSFEDGMKSERTIDKVPDFASSSDSQPPTSHNDTQEQQKFPTPASRGFQHSADSAFGTPMKYSVDQDYVYESPSYVRSSPQCFPGVENNRNHFLHPNPHDQYDSSYSTSPCSMSSSASCGDIAAYYLNCDVIGETTNDAQNESESHRKDESLRKALRNFDDTYSEHDNAVGSYMEEILNEVIKNVEVACVQLQIPSDPKLWTDEQVQKWVNWTIGQYKLPSPKDTRLGISGRRLCELNEIDLRAMAPECGDFLHAHLEIWRTVVDSNSRQYSEEQNRASTMAIHKFEKTAAEDSPACFQEKPILDTQTSRKTLQELRKAEDAIAVMTPNHTAGIHLWQFLKELLLQPHLYGQYIRWIDKEKGVFKIEDSVEVARLWGIRKNRPAMNYDKLSRSIRQYYKKGIIKKTEISQRLVYQFVKPVV